MFFLLKKRGFLIKFKYMNPHNQIKYIIKIINNMFEQNMRSE